MTIEKTIRDLFKDKDKYHCIDIDVVAEMVASFVLSQEDVNAAMDVNGYETYYKVLGKAVAITQGWKLNCGEGIKLPSETKENLEKYMENTYGKEKLPR